MKQHPTLSPDRKSGHSNERSAQLFRKNSKKQSSAIILRSISAPTPRTHKFPTNCPFQARHEQKHRKLQICITFPQVTDEKAGVVVVVQVEPVIQSIRTTSSPKRRVKIQFIEDRTKRGTFFSVVRHDGTRIRGDFSCFILQVVELFWLRLTSGNVFFFREFPQVARYHPRLLKECILSESLI